MTVLARHRLQTLIWGAIVTIGLIVFFSVGYNCFALPEIDHVVSGNVDFVNIDANTLQINASDKAIVNYASFNIAENETVIFNMPGSASEILNRVTGGSMSSILGSLLSNGIVFLVNESGIYFGPTANINVQGLVASTRDITDTDFLSSNYVFERMSKDQLDKLMLNKGSINIKSGGFGVFIAGAIENQGTIVAPLGTIAMAGGDKVTLAIAGNGLISIAIDQATAANVYDINGQPVTSQIRNTGSISAPGGVVLLKAESLPDLFEYAINLDGIVRADKLEAHNGKIKIVSSGKIKVNTEISATDIEIGEIGGVMPSILEMPLGGKLTAESSVTAGAIQRLEVNSASPLTHIYKQGDISLTSSSVDNGLITVAGDDIKVTYINTNNLTLQASGNINAEPGVIIQGSQVKLIAQKFGTAELPVNVDAAYTYISRITGDIYILESQGLGTSILLRGPPDGFGAIIYTASTNLTLEAKEGSIHTASEAALISASTLNLIAKYNIGTQTQHLYFNADYLGTITAQEGSIYLDSHNTDVYITANITANSDINIYSQEGHIEATDANVVISSITGSINLETTTGHIALIGTVSAPEGTLRFWTSTHMSVGAATRISKDGTYIWNPEDGQTVTWTGRGDGTSWEDPANWDTGTVPASDDDVIINLDGADVTTALPGKVTTITVRSLILGNSDGSARCSLTLNKDLIVTGNLTIYRNATLTSRESGDISIAGNFSNNDGAFIHNSGTVTFNGTAQNISGTISFYHFSIKSDSALTGPASGIINIAGDWTNSGTFTHNNSTVVFNGGTQNISGSSTTTFYNLTINTGSTVTCTSSITLNNSFTNNGTFNQTAGTTTIAGTMTLTAGKAYSFYNLTINASRTLTGPASGTINIAGDFINNGTFTHNNSTVVFNGGKQNISGSSTTTFYNLTINTGSTVTCTSSITLNNSFTNNGTFNQTAGTTTIAGTMTLTAGKTYTFYNLTINTSRILTAPASGAIYIGGSLSVNGSFTHNNCSVIFTGATGSMGGTNTAAISFYNLTINSGIFTTGRSIIVNGAYANGGTLTQSGTTTFTLAASTNLTGNNTFVGFIINSGVVVNCTGNLTVSGSFTNNGTFTQTAGTTTFSGTMTLTAGATYSFYNLTINTNRTLTAPLNGTINIAGTFTRYGTFTPNGCTVIFNGSGAQTLTGLIPFTINFYNLTINSGATLTVAGGGGSEVNTLNISGNFTNNGTLNPNGCLIVFNGTTQSVAGYGATTFYDLTINTGSTVTCTSSITINNSFTNNGTFNQTAGTTTIAGTMTLTAGKAYSFYNLTINALNTLTGPLGGIINIAGNLTLNGIFIPNSSTVVFNGSGTQTISGFEEPFTINFYNLTINSGATLNVPTGGILGGNTLNISGDFANNGTFIPNDSTVVFSGGAQVISGSSTTTFYDLTINTGSTVTCTSSITLNNSFTNNGTFNQTAGTTTIAGTMTLTAGKTYSFYNLTINASRTLTAPLNGTINIAGTLTRHGAFIPNGCTVVFNGSDTQTITGLIPFTINFYNLTINSGVTLTVAGGTEFGANTLDISGDFTNNGTFIPNDSIVVFSGSSLQTITSGGSSFNILTITNTSADGVKFADALHCATLNAANDGGGVQKIAFAPSVMHTVTANFNVGGSSGNLIELTHADAGNWMLTAPSTTLNYIRVSYSTATNIIYVNNSTNAGNNINWSFPLDHFVLSEIADPVAGNPNSITVTAYDADGYIKTDYSGMVTLSSTDAKAVLPAAHALSGGSYTFTGLILKTAGSQTVTATGDAKTGSQTVTITPAAANYLYFYQEPTNSAAGISITPAVAVQVMDIYGNPRDGDVVTISIGTNPAGGTLSGTTSAVTSNGKAVFSDLSIDRKGTGYTLTATSGKLNKTSDAFNIVASAAYALRWTTQPQAAATTDELWRGFSIEIVDRLGNRTNDTDIITIAPNAGSFTGTISQAAIAGVATFTDISYKNVAKITVVGSASGLISTSWSSVITVTLSQQKAEEATQSSNIAVPKINLIADDLSFFPALNAKIINNVSIASGAELINLIGAASDGSAQPKGELPSLHTRISGKTSSPGETETSNQLKSGSQENGIAANNEKVEEIPEEATAVK